jgi:hypothetical protein
MNARSVQMCLPFLNTFSPVLPPVRSMLSPYFYALLLYLPLPILPNLNLRSFVLGLTPFNCFLHSFFSFSTEILFFIYSHFSRKATKPKTRAEFKIFHTLLLAMDNSRFLQGTEK